MMKKISEYSPKDWKPKLTIDTQGIKDQEALESFYQEVKNYSITPTTLKGRSFKTGSTDPIYIEEYEFKGNSVTRFGINIYNKEFRTRLDQELQIHNEGLQEEILEQSEKITNISGKTNYENFSKHIQLTECEKLVLNEAISYMNANDKKVILVDIFPRESSQNKATKEPSGRINLAKLDTHTVLLHKSEENKALAIDPNNPMFSTHLNKYTDYQIQTLCSTDEKYKIYSRPEKSTTGFAPDKFRDCIDIAVKFALLLNQDKGLYKTIEEVMQSNVVKLITNNSKIDGMDFTINNLIREKQSSNTDKVILSNQRMQEISNKITQEDLRYKEELKKVEEQHFSILNELYQNKDSLVEGLQHEYSANLLGNNQEEM